MRKVIAAVLLLSASTGAFAAVPAAVKAIADCCCPGCPDCPHDK